MNDVTKEIEKQRWIERKRDREKREGTAQKKKLYNFWFEFFALVLKRRCFFFFFFVCFFIISLLWSWWWWWWIFFHFCLAIAVVFANVGKPDFWNENTKSNSQTNEETREGQHTRLHYEKFKEYIKWFKVCAREQLLLSAFFLHFFLFFRELCDCKASSSVNEF